MNEKHLKILVIEDEHIDTARDYFKSVGKLRTDFATTACEAIERLNKEKYDGVITDRNFPNRKGESPQSNGPKVVYESIIKGIPYVEISNHGPVVIYTFPIRRINADEVKEAGSYEEWGERYEVKGEQKHLASAFTDEKEIKDPIMVIGQYALHGLDKNITESWEEAFSVLRRSIEMYKKGGDLVSYFLEKARLENN